MHKFPSQPLHPSGRCRATDGFTGESESAIWERGSAQAATAAVEGLAAVLGSEQPGGGGGDRPAAARRAD